MKAFTIVRDIIVIIACLCVILLTAEVVALEAKVGHAVQQIRDSYQPDPATTGCPVGNGECGG